jgi:GTP cyclohydrolase III
VDGDDIGNRLELMLLDGDIDSARRFSESLDRAMRESASAAKARGADLIYAGGDGLLAIVQGASPPITLGQELQATFQQVCGCTLSVGIGPDASSATMALHRAKLLGKNRIVSVGTNGATQL